MPNLMTRTVTAYRCHRCGAWFVPRTDPTPARMGRCGKCKSPYWHTSKDSRPRARRKGDK